MRQEAIQKINEALQKRPNDTYLEIVAHYIIDRCADGDGAAAAALEDGKTLEGCMGAITKVAQQAARNNVGVVSSLELYDTIDAYFGFTRDEGARQKHAESVCTGGSCPPAPTAAARPAHRAAALLNFDDFL